MKFRKIKPKKLKRYLPTILSAGACVGVIFTAVASSKAAVKAEKEETKAGKVKCYIWTAIIAGTTIVCIVGSDRINRKRQAGLLAAYALLEKRFREYQTGVKEVLGDDAHQQVVDHIVKSECTPPDIWVANFVGEIGELIPSNLEDKDLTRTFYDLRSKRYFESTLARVIQAEYYINRDMNLGKFITLNDMYSYFGLEGVPGGDDVGYDVCDDYYWIDFNHKLVTLDDGMEVIGIEVAFDPAEPE